ncbi:hypothetical protein MKW98_020253 [Papaver atlanticum]|uniref:Uncharacterized protein n=1 Tax=Papaver atlanticum TaxID=357466 RepID=A0AAD4TFC7_9MAGN|nr:hypothetical protein MKW98_020253 [Papaver atlanticum]
MHERPEPVVVEVADPDFDDFDRDKSEGYSCKSRRFSHQIPAIRLNDEKQFFRFSYAVWGERLLNECQIWREIYTGLDPIVAKELSTWQRLSRKGMAESLTNNSKNISSTVSNPRSTTHISIIKLETEKGNASILGVTDFFLYMELNIEESSSDEVYCKNADNGYDVSLSKACQVGSCTNSNVKEAELLIRVKLIKEQTVYMLEVSDFMKWEDAFLADFSEQRRGAAAGGGIFSSSKLHTVDMLLHTAHVGTLIYWGKALEKASQSQAVLDALGEPIGSATRRQCILLINLLMRTCGGLFRGQDSPNSTKAAACKDEFARRTAIIT